MEGAPVIIALLAKTAFNHREGVAMMRCAILIFFFPLTAWPAEPSVPALVKQLGDPDAGRRVLAAEALAQLAPAAVEAAPALTKMVAELDPLFCRLQEIDVLRNLVPFGMNPYVVLAFVTAPNAFYRQNDDEMLVLSAADAALRRMGPKAIPAFAAEFRRAAPLGRGRIVDLFSSLPTDCGEAIPFLTQALSDSDAKVRFKAATVLSHFGGLAAPAAPQLLNLLNKDDYCGDPSSFLDAYDSTKRAAAKALRQIGPERLGELEKKSLRQFLKKLQNNGNRLNQRAATTALIELGPMAKEALPFMRESILRPKTKSDNAERWIEVLWAIGPHALPTLRELIKKRDPNVGQAIARSMPLDTKEYHWKHPFVREMLKSGDCELTRAMVERLRQMYPPPKETIADLVALLALVPPKDKTPSNIFFDKERDVPELACAVLHEIGDPAVAPCIKFLEDEDQPPEARFRALTVLCQAGAGARNALPVLRKTMLEPRADVACWSMYACVRFGDDPEALGALITALSVDDPDEQIYVLNILARLGAKALPAENAIIGFLESDEKQVRQNAARALSGLGPRALKATAALKEYNKRFPDDSTVDKPNNPALLAAMGFNLGEPSAGPIRDRLKDPKRLKQLIQKLENPPPGPGSPFPLRGDTNNDTWTQLVRMGPEAKAFLPSALRALQRGIGYSRYNAAAFIGAIGPEAKAAVPALIALASTRYSKDRLVALDALSGIGPQAKQALPVIEKCLLDPELDVRMAAAFARFHVAGDPTILLEMGPSYYAQTNVRLRRIWRLETDRDVVELRVLGDLASKDDKSFRVLLAALQAHLGAKSDPGGEVTRQIAKLRGRAAALAPRIVESIQHEDEADCLARLIHALAAIGPKAKESLPLLMKLRFSFEPSVADAAEEAVRKIQGD
jgi:HEAT repeat protein